MPGASQKKRKKNIPSPKGLEEISTTKHGILRGTVKETSSNLPTPILSGAPEPKIANMNLENKYYDIVSRSKFDKIANVVAFARTEVNENIPWTRLLNSVLETTDHPTESSLTLRVSELFKLFCDAAEPIVKTLIKEKDLIEGRTILPKKVKGYAGGTKYVIGQQLFKFVDAMSEALKYLEATSYAYKLARNEVLSFQELAFCRVMGLNFPMVALMSFCGESILVSSLVEGIEVCS